jgi:hypothetical protein
LNKTLELNAHTFHIDAYSLALLGTIFTGLNFALLLGFTKKAIGLRTGFLPWRWL